MEYKYIKEKLSNQKEIEDILIKVLKPVEKFNKEKLDSGIWDDWNEYLHDKKTYSQIAQEINNGEKYNLYVYYIEYNNEVIGTVFFINNKNTIENILQKCNLKGEDIDYQSSIQLTSFHIAKEHRGIGLKWLKEIIFLDLIEMGYINVFVKSSHYKAFTFYERLGEKVGEYIGISDNKQYQRLGNIYKCKLGE